MKWANGTDKVARKLRMPLRVLHDGIQFIFLTVGLFDSVCADFLDDAQRQA